MYRSGSTTYVAVDTSAVTAHAYNRPEVTRDLSFGDLFVVAVGYDLPRHPDGAPELGLVRYLASFDDRSPLTAAVETRPVTLTTADRVGDDPAVRAAIEGERTRTVPIDRTDDPAAPTAVSATVPLDDTPTTDLRVRIEHDDERTVYHGPGADRTIAVDDGSSDDQSSGEGDTDDGPTDGRDDQSADGGAESTDESTAADDGAADDTDDGASIPGFGVGAAIGGLGIACYWLRRRAGE